MSIAIPTYAPGSINSYSDLVAEIRDMMDDADYSQVAIDRALRKAEAAFNRDLRTPEMETRSVLTITQEITQQPEDFLQLRYIFSEGSPDAPLKSMSPAAMLATYAGRAGIPEAYAIEAGGIRVGPVGNAAVEIVYYRKIPALSDAQVSNWLLQTHPDLYVAGCLYYLGRRERDKGGAADAWQEIMALVASINRAAQDNRWGAAPLIAAGIRQVSNKVRI